MERYWVWEYGLFEKNPKRVDSLNPETTLEVVKLADAQATVEALQAQLRLANIDQANAEARANDLQQQVEALRRELLEWKRALCGLTPGGSEFADDHAYCAEWVRKARENQHDIIISKHRKLKATQAFLDAEREKVKGLAQQVQDQSTANLETMRHTDDMQSRALDAERALAHLQALVRAWGTAHESVDDWFKRAATDENTPTISEFEAVKKVLFDSERALKATLDATTPAECTNHFTDGSKIFPSRNCCSKGGDGE